MHQKVIRKVSSRTRAVSTIEQGSLQCQRRGARTNYDSGKLFVLSCQGVPPKDVGRGSLLSSSPLNQKHHKFIICKNNIPRFIYYRWARLSLRGRWSQIVLRVFINGAVHIAALDNCSPPVDTVISEILAPSSPSLPSPHPKWNARG